LPCPPVEVLLNHSGWGRKESEKGKKKHGGPIRGGEKSGGTGGKCSLEWGGYQFSHGSEKREGIAWKRGEDVNQPTSAERIKQIGQLLPKPQEG